VVGVFLTTPTEIRRGRFHISTPVPISETPVWDGVKFVVISLGGFLLIMTALVFIEYGITRLALGSHYCMTPSMKMSSGLSFLAGAGFAKYFRYLYWKAQ